MNDYIDRSALLKELERFPHLKTAESVVRSMPKAEVVEVRHGRWLLGKSGVMYSCDTCGYAAHPREQEEWIFCPRCGSKMDGERKEQE